MTEIRRAVIRRTVDGCRITGRKLIVAFEPGDVLAFREERRRRWFRAPISKVFTTVLLWNVDAERALKRKKK